MTLYKSTKNYFEDNQESIEDMIEAELKRDLGEPESASQKFPMG